MKHYIKNKKDKAKILKIKNKYSSDILKQKDITGIGVGVKSVNGKLSDELAVIIMVKKKLPKNKISKNRLLPKYLDKHKVDVIETGEIKATAVYDAKIRPAIPGYSCGHPEITAGTFGCVVYKGATRYLLSNNHVIANRNDCNVGDKIYQPGVADGGVEADTIATLSEWVTIEENVNVDCAIAEITSPELVSDVGVWGGSIDNYTEPELNDVIFKTGRTTGTTIDILSYEHVDMNINYGGSLGTITITDCFATVGNDSVQGGDSGSVGRLDDNIAVGLAFASATSIPISYINVYIYMSNVVSALSLDLPYIAHPTDLRYTLYSQGSKSPSDVINTGTHKTSDGSSQSFEGDPWSNPGNAKISNDNFAIFGPYTGDGRFSSNFLVATDFGFSIPSDAIIQRILLEVECKRDGSLSNIDFRVFSRNDNRSSFSGWSVSMVYITTDLEYKSFNLTNFTMRWSVEEINSSGFGVEMWENNLLNAVNANIYVGHIRLTIYYVTPQIQTQKRKVIINRNHSVITNSSRKTVVIR